jgi:deazaflavin-dependent oxidoreductase (nitroreductase family)
VGLVALPEIAYRLIGRFSVTRFDRALHPVLYRISGGRGVVGRVLGGEVILLTTTGRRTGQPRTVALFGWREPGGWAVVASRGGSRRIPAWYRNLAADPRVTVQSRGTTVVAVARELSGSEYETAFEHAADVYPGYRLYRRESPVHIPIVMLEATRHAGHAT